MEIKGFIDKLKALRGVNQDALPSSLPDEYPDIEPATEPIVVYECKDTRYMDGEWDGDWMDVLARHNQVYNQSVSKEWLDADPAEDRLIEVRKEISETPTRIGPNY